MRGSTCQPTDFNCIVLKLLPLRGKILFGPCSQNRVLIPFIGSF